MDIGTWLHTALYGRLVGRDAEGNRYYEEKRKRADYPRARRWVMYAGIIEASAIPPEWHAWLHYTTQEPLTEMPHYPWQKPHQENLTGTPNAYRPPGHEYEGGRQPRATGDYEAWTP